MLEGLKRESLGNLRASGQLDLCRTASGQKVLNRAEVKPDLRPSAGDL